MDYTSRRYALAHWYDKSHLKEVLQYLEPKKNEKILEVGCSRGFVVKALQELGFHVQGVDVNKQAIKEGVAHNLQHMSATQLKFGDSGFDKIYSFHAIEHVPDIAKALQEMERVLKPGGKLLLVYPAEPIRGLFALGAAFIFQKNPRDIHVHKLTPQKLKELLKSSSLKHKHSRFSLFSSPQFFSIFQKEV